jgi:Glycosyltransferase family 9 (heptosyltransferase)
MRIQHEGRWINVDEQPINPWDVQQRQKSLEADTNLFSPHLSDAATREKAMELIPSIAKAASDKKRPRFERVKLLRTLSAFQKTAYLVQEQLETAKSILKFSKCAQDFHHLGIAYSFAGKTREACDCFIRAGELPHRNDAYIHQDYQRALLHQMRWKEAADHYQTHANTSQPSEPSGRFKHWEGEKCERAAILATGGFGDVIFWARFIPIIARRVKSLAYVVPEISSETRIISGVICRGFPDDLRDLLRLQGYEVQTENESLGTEYPIRIITVGWQVLAYLGLEPDSEELKNIPTWVADPVRVQRYKDLRCDSRPTIGICWRAEAFEYGGDTRGIYRQLTNDQAHRIIEETKNKVNWVSLQYKGEKVHEALQTPEISDWNDTAAIISNLDAVVSVDTAVMHLSGAMRKPVYTLLGVDTDRKFPLGDRNPFYPTMKQIHNDGWGFDDAVQNVISELHERNICELSCARQP